MATLTKRTSLCLLLMLLLPAGESGATERVQRRFDASTGLTISTIFSLAQDAEGFIWIGTAGGVVRYDGNQMRPWAKDIINARVETLVPGPSGEVLVAQEFGKLYRVVAQGLEPIAGPDGLPFEEVRSAAFDKSGNLWVVTSGGVIHLREGNTNWRRFDGPGTLAGERVHRVMPGANNRVYLLTGQAVWESHNGGTPRKIFAVQRPLRVLEHPGGSLFVLAWQTDGEVIEFREGRATNRLTLPERPIDIGLRGNVVWASFSHHLTSIRGAEPPDVFAVDSGGPLLVDHEGSLWTGTFSGLVQYPEPETTIWNQKDGLPSAHTRSIAQTSEGLWVTTWQGMGLLVREGNAWRARPLPMHTNAHPCVLSTDEIMIHTAEGVFQRQSGRFIKRPGLEPFHRCARTSDGTVLLTTPKGLFRVPQAGPPEALKAPAGEYGLSAILVDRAQRLWVADDTKVCNANSQTVIAGGQVQWACQEITDAHTISDIVELPSGNIWLATGKNGVWRYSGDRWEQIPGSRSLASGILFALLPAPSGGVWLAGYGGPRRVAERPESEAGWEVVEILSTWEGLAGSETSEIIEEANGDIWLSTPSGVVRVPAEARRAEATAPRVKLVDVVISGRSMSTEVAPSRLAYGSQVELHFAALSYRDRGRLRYQYRLRSDAPWIDSRDNAPVLRFVDLGAGDYQAEVRASLDGVNWTAVPAQLSFQVLSPWYLRPITLLLLAIVVAAILYAIYRARMRSIMRLERQRAQIARDLHDEMGSGLGSIGILSGLAAEDKLAAAQHQEIAKKIAKTAAELGVTLSEIVWALKPGSATIEALGYHLAERGGRMFPGDETVFATDFPDAWPRLELSLAARRNVLLIASEAMHNAARHAGAEHVTLGLRPAEAGRWRLWLNDDGCGLDNKQSAANGSGMGIQNMQRRADEIGASFSLAPNNGQGTLLSLTFDPQANDRTFRQS